MRIPEGYSLIIKSKTKGYSIKIVDGDGFSKSFAINIREDNLIDAINELLADTFNQSQDSEAVQE